MTPTHATNDAARYHYYVSRSLLAGGEKDTGQRIPASSLEALVMRRLRDWLSDSAAMLDIVQHHTSDAATQKLMMDGLHTSVTNWQDLTADDIRDFVLSIIARIQVHSDRIDTRPN